MNINRFYYLVLFLALAASVSALYPLVTWFMTINVLTLMIYGIDKRAAQKERRRIPEATLLLYGFTGGWPGAILGQQLFRHKTQKQPFRTWFYLTVLLNLVALVALWLFFWRQ